MIDNYPTPVQTSPRSALQIQLQAREMEKQQAQMVAGFSGNTQGSVQARSENPLKNLLVNLFSGMRVADRELVSARK